MIENPARIASKLRNFSARPDPSRAGPVQKNSARARPARPASGPARLTPLVLYYVYIRVYTYY